MLGQMINVTTCPRCRGDGKVVETPCDTCKGEGRVERRRTLQVTIPPGIDEGHQIRLANEGEAGPRSGPAGSLYVAVHVAPHPTLKREGTELIYEASVGIAQAALGTTILVPTVEGEESVEVKAGTQPGTRSGFAAAASRTSDGPGSAATSMSSSTSRSRSGSRARSARRSRPMRTRRTRSSPRRPACSIE